MAELVNVDCILCGSAEKKFLFKANDAYFHVNKDQYFNIVECVRCGLAYISPRPTPEDLSQYYPDETYWPALLEDDDVLAGRILPKVKPYVDLARELFGDRKGSLLDIGCGDGAFMKTFQALGWEVTGIDQSEQVARGLRDKFGMDAHHSFAEDFTSDKKFDFITINHVLEHLSDPFSTIAAVRNNLVKEDGVLAIGVPNFGCYQAKFFKASWDAVHAPRHLYHYNPSTIRILLEKNGFEITKITYPIFSNFNRMSFRMHFYGKKDFTEEDRKSDYAIARLKNRLLLSAGKYAAEAFSHFTRAINSCDSMVVVARPSRPGGEAGS